MDASEHINKCVSLFIYLFLLLVHFWQSQCRGVHPLAQILLSFFF